MTILKYPLSFFRRPHNADFKQFECPQEYLNHSVYKLFKCAYRMTALNALVQHRERYRHGNITAMIQNKLVENGEQVEFQDSAPFVPDPRECVSVCVSWCVCACVRACMRACVRACVRLRLRLRLRMCACACACIRVRADPSLKSRCRSTTLDLAKKRLPCRRDVRTLTRAFALKLQTYL